MNKILLADDHSVIRTGLELVINECVSNCETRHATNGKEIINQLKNDNFDLVIMDIRMPDTDALDMTHFIKARYPDTRVLIFSISPEEIYGTRFLKEGAKGYISKDASIEELKKAILLVLNGGLYLSTKLMEFLACSSFSETPLNPFGSLTKREFEVVSKILAGEVAKSIARTLNLSPSTIGTHKSRVFEKLNVTSIIELKELADFHGIN